MSALRKNLDVPGGDLVVDGLSIQQAAAPTVKRVIAYTVDLGIVAGAIYLLVIVLGIVFGFAAFGLFAGKWEKSGLVAISVGVAILIVGVLAVIHGYFVYFEAKTGATPGKRLFGLRVVSVDGRKLRVGQCVQRDLMRFIDCALVLPGFVAIALNDERRRLGDLVAGTRVVYSASQERRQNFLYIRQEDYLYYAALLHPPNVPDAECKIYLEVAFRYFLKLGTHTRSRDADFKQMLGIAVHLLGDQANGQIETSDLLLFLAEHCHQCLYTRSATP